MICLQTRFPSVALSIVMVLVFSLHQSARGDEEVCETLCYALSDVISAGFNESAVARLLDHLLHWGNDTTEQTDVLTGVCNLLVLYDLGQSLLETDVVHVYSSRLLRENLLEACRWLYGENDPDHNCEDSLRFFCFWKGTDRFKLNYLLDRGCDSKAVGDCKI